MRIQYVVLLSLMAPLAAQAPKAKLQFPDAPGRDTVQKVCGSCHGAEVIVPRGMTRQQWGDVIASMVTRGAKGTDEEFAQVLDYLSTNFPPSKTAVRPATASASTAAPARRG